MKITLSPLTFACAAILLPSCSCGIRSESWRPAAGSSDRTAIVNSAIAVGFRREGELLKKQDSYLWIAEDTGRIRLQSSWCPFPHHLPFHRSMARWNHRSDAIRDQFLKKTSRSGITLRNDDA